jgi:hypothetical protein
MTTPMKVILVLGVLLLKSNLHNIIIIGVANPTKAKAILNNNLISLAFLIVILIS